MAAVIMERCIFLHTPKTGGLWALEALRRQGIVLATLKSPDGSDHPTLATVRAVHHLPIIATVRDPFTWLRSLWRFFYRRNWRPSTQGPIPALEPLLEMAAPTFAEFANRYLHRRPGYISELMALYADGADFVCHQERLTDDLIAALEAFDQPHIVSTITTTPQVNVSHPFAADCPKEIERAIQDADRWVVETFYHSAPVEAAHARG